MERRQFDGSSLALAATWPRRGFTSGLKCVGDMPAKSLAGEEIVPLGAPIETFAAGLRGELLLAGVPSQYRRSRGE